MEVDESGRVVRPKELKRVDHRHVLNVQDGALGVVLEIDDPFHAERPEETRRQDAAVEVVHLRPRTGVEEVDSNQGERTLVRHAIDDELALERANVGFEVVRPAIARARSADMERDRSRSIEVRDCRRFVIEALKGDSRKGKGHGGIAWSKDVDDYARSQWDSSRNWIRNLQALG
jgi:hypothetical protein